MVVVRNATKHCIMARHRENTSKEYEWLIMEYDFGLMMILS